MRFRRKPTSIKKKLEDECEALSLKIFHLKPCVVCLSDGKYVNRTFRHHIIPVGRECTYRYEIWNIIPVCPNHTSFDLDIAAHSMNPEAMDRFMAWLEQNLLQHFKWYQDHNNKNIASKLYAADLEKIRDELKLITIGKYSYGEDIIYEKGL